MTARDNDSDDQKPPFPAWLRELCYFGGLIVTLCVFALGLRSDLRSTREEVGRQSLAISDIQNRLPNQEADRIRFQVLQDEVRKNKADTDFAIAKLEKFHDDVNLMLVKKGIM